MIVIDKDDGKLTGSVRSAGQWIRVNGASDFSPQTLSVILCSI